MLDFFHSSLIVYFIPTDSKNNCFEHNKSNCMRSLTWLYGSAFVVSAFAFCISECEKSKSTPGTWKMRLWLRAPWHILVEHVSLFPILLVWNALRVCFIDTCYLCLFRKMDCSVNNYVFEKQMITFSRKTDKFLPHLGSSICIPAFLSSHLCYLPFTFSFIYISVHNMNFDWDKAN